MVKDESTDSSSSPLVSLRVSCVDKKKCPFVNEKVSFELHPGSCVFLRGNSGAGKTTLATYLAALSPPSTLTKLGIHVDECAWDPSIPDGERCGVLFQQTTLLDSLTVAGNVCAALENCPSERRRRKEGKGLSSDERDKTIAKLLESVGLNYERDGPKRPPELSGGMARRASLALQLAQHKRVIVLDEPFAGLDYDAAAEVAKKLARLRVEQNTALLLISHEPDIAALVMDKKNTKNNHVVTLDSLCHENTTKTKKKPNLFGRSGTDRFLAKLADYLLWSMPLIFLTFVACGLAIAMLSSDILRRIDVTDQVIGIVDKEVRPLLKMVTGEEEASPLYMMMIKMKVRNMLNDTIPGAKAKLYALGMAKLFVLEIGPLVTALLLSGRIGGSYSGDVATLRATRQDDLLRTLGIDPRSWTLLPAMAATLLASPVLTVFGTATSLLLGSFVGPSYGIGTTAGYMDEIKEAIFPSLRLRMMQAWEECASEESDEEKVCALQTSSNLFAFFDMRSTMSNSYFDALIEIVTYPPCFHLVKSCTYAFIVLATAEMVVRLKARLTPRNVPGAITSSVVISSLLIIIADWGFSQLLLKRV